MSTQLKKGFTLIELMVVIVIIGILAAIAIPKLFGMSAKAKASEVGPAAGTWLKMQMAYTLEKDLVGSFTSIGYTPPSETGKGSFDYTDNTPPTIAADTDAEWEAKRITKLNDACNTNSDTWTAKYNKDGEITTTIAGGGGCEALTPSFDKLKDQGTTAQSAASGSGE